MPAPIQGDLGFTFREHKSGAVQIFRHGALAVTLRGHVAASFLAEAALSDFRDAQQLMARVTGNYKRGNERLASQHPRHLK